MNISDVFLMARVVYYVVFTTLGYIKVFVNSNFQRKNILDKVKQVKETLEGPTAV